MTKKPPQGWASATVGDLAEYINGLAFKPSDWEKTGRPIIRIQNLNDPEASYNFTQKEYDSRFIVLPDDILVSWSATLDAFRWNGPEAVLNQHIFRVIPREQVIDKDFLFWGLKLVIKEMWESEHTHGSTMKHINRGPFLAHGFPLPPMQEQRRILAKLDRLFAHRRQAAADLKTIPVLLGRLRQETLAAAFRGNLTADWRAKHPDVEPAGKLLDRIRAERRCRWEETELARLIAKGKPPTDDCWKERYEPAAPPESGGLPVLPFNWRWSNLGELFTVHVGATPSRGETRFWGGGIPWVSSGEVAFSRIVETREKITREGLERTSTRLHPPGTVLLGMIGEGRTRGQAAILDVEACNNQNCAAIRVSESPISPEYVFYWLWRQYSATRESGSGNNQPALNKTKVEELLIPVAPLEEQAEILRHVSRLLASAESVARQTDEAGQSLQSLEQAILAEAFRGELVPQDPNDEPASVLLERLRAESAAEPARRAARRSRQPDPEQAPAEPVPTASTAAASDKPTRRRRSSADAVTTPAAMDPPTSPASAPARRVAPFSELARPGEQAALAFPADATPFLDLPADAQAEQVHAVLLGEGPLPREDAVRRAAEILRDQGRAEFHRLRSDGTLATAIDHAISLAIRQGRIDRPQRGSVRALARTPADVPPAVWRRAIVAAQAATPDPDPDPLVRAAATWLQSQVGLEFQRLRTGGHIDTALRQALAATSSRG